MKNSRGITMASLVVIIASIILLSTMAVSYGYRYLTETKKADEKYFKEVLSNAIIKRENNYNTNTSKYPRIGYKIITLESFQDIINKYLPELKDNSENLFNGGLWYIIDTKAADKLGVKGSSDYIDVYDVDSTEEFKVALVDYYTGDMYIINIKDVNDLQGVSGDVSNIIGDEHTHIFNIENATCTLDKKCAICGYVEEVALGHDYNDGLPYEPVDDEFHSNKKCKRCEMKSGYERHTDLDKFVFHESGDGSWYHYYIGCSRCGWPGADKIYQKCDVTIKSTSGSGQIKQCRQCKHQEPLETGSSVVVKLKVGDYVSYRPDGTYNGTAANTSMQWRVWSVNGSNVEITPTLTSSAQNTLSLSGVADYLDLVNNAASGTDKINQACKAYYTNSTLGITGANIRSMTVEDIDEKTGYDKTTYKNTVMNKKYGETKDYTRGNYFYTYEEDGRTITSSIPKVASLSSPVTVKLTNYYYNPSSYSHVENSSITVGSLLGSVYGWLASPCVGLDTSLTYFYVRCASSNYMSSHDLAYSDGDGYSYSSGLHPIVSLSSELKASAGDGTSGNPWQLSK